VDASIECGGGAVARPHRPRSRSHRPSPAPAARPSAASGVMRSLPGAPRLGAMSRRGSWSQRTRAALSARANKRSSWTQAPVAQVRHGAAEAARPRLLPHNVSFCCERSIKCGCGATRDGPDKLEPGPRSRYTSALDGSKPRYAEAGRCTASRRPVRRRTTSQRAHTALLARTRPQRKCPWDPSPCV
jgi:hypothetical protein